MLPRVLETEVMDTAEDARAYDLMDHTAVNRLFVDDFLAIWSGINPILDVGTGTAQIPIALCRQSDTARVVAIDLAGEMLTVAQRNVARASLQKRIRLEACDAKSLPWADGTFLAVMSNSIVHHIPEPGAVLAEMVRVLAPGGALFVRDLLRPDSEEALRHLVQSYTVGCDDYQRQLFADSLRAALTLAEVRALAVSLGIDAAEVRQTSDRHWTWATHKK
jgi:ubiquinone/menaquinone biosynthesis C-methylase UbiE